MVDDPEEIILPMLRKMYSSLDEAKEERRELKVMVVQLREEVNGLRTDILRQDRSIAGIDLKLERIEKRLDLVDA